MPQHQKPQPPLMPSRGNDMEERDPTPAELAALGDVSVPTIHAPIDPSRDDDYDDGLGQPRAAAPTITDMNDRFGEILALMEKQQQQAAGGSNEMIATAMMAMAEAMRGFGSAQKEGANTIADMQRRVQMPENRFAPMISAYNLRGEREFPRPALRCPTLLEGIPFEAEVCTREEIELLNLLEPCEVIIRRNDDTGVKVLVSAEMHLDSNQPSKIKIQHGTAFNNDQHKQMAKDWIRQIVEANPRTRDQGKMVLTMREEAALIVAKKFNNGVLAEEGQRLVSVGV